MFSGALPAFTGSEVDILLSTPFLYNSGQGNLLLDVFGSNVTPGDVPLDARNGTAGDIFSRMVGPGEIGTSSAGLVTGFNTTTVPVPGPIAGVAFLA